MIDDPARFRTLIELRGLPAPETRAALTRAARVVHDGRDDAAEHMAAEMLLVLLERDRERERQA